jgi:hypothetical protein
MFKSTIYAVSLSIAAITFSSSQANGLFEDLEYPDNKNRLERAEELSFDIKSLTSQLANDRVQIENKLQTANSVVIHALKTHISISLSSTSAMTGPQRSLMLLSRCLSSHWQQLQSIRLLSHTLFLREELVKQPLHV